jgi:hypothetical protein
MKRAGGQTQHSRLRPSERKYSTRNTEIWYTKGFYCLSIQNSVVSLAQSVTLLTCILKVPGSNLSQDTECATISWSYSVLLGEFRQQLKLDHGHFLPHSLQISYSPQWRYVVRLTGSASLHWCNIGSRIVVSSFPPILLALCNRASCIQLVQ